jgi:hypothetical protein
MNKLYKFLFAGFILFLSNNYVVLAEESENAPKVIQPNFINNTDSHSLYGQTEIERSFDNKIPQLEYFLQEITNFVDSGSSIYFYDYINPNVPEQAFSSERFNIFKKMLLLKNIEKSKREREASHDIEKFLVTNYKTQSIPSYVYANNPHLPEPLYMSRLVNDAFEAIRKNDIDALHALVNNYDLIDSKDAAGNGLLATAIAANRNNMVKFLVSKDSNVNAANNQGVTPLMVAAWTGNLEAADFLTREKIDIQKLDSKGMSALDYAKANNNIRIYFLLKNKIKKLPVKKPLRRRR